MKQTKRTLKYKLHKANYSKLKTNKKYYKDMLPKLKFWYLYNEYGVDTASLYLHKSRRNQMHMYIKYFDFIDLPYSTNGEAVAYVNRLLYKGNECLHCNKDISGTPKKLFCSVKCANRYKVDDPIYKENQSKGLKQHNAALTEEEKKAKNANISKGNKRFYENEKEEDKIKRLAGALEKSKITYLENYGCEWAASDPEIKRKALESRRETNLERYGCTCFFANQEYIDSVDVWPRQKHYTNMENLNKEFITKTFLKDGVFDFEGCLNYFNMKAEGTLYTFIRNNIENIEHVDRGSLKGVGKYKKEEEINEEFNGIFTLRTKNVIHPLELDLYSKEHSIAIEYDGLMWHSFGKSEHSMFNNYLKEEKDKNKHLTKTELCEEKGIRLFHIFEDEYLNKTKRKTWISIINESVGLSTGIEAQECTAKELPNTNEEMCKIEKFINMNSLQTYIYNENNINIGLYYEEELMQIMIFDMNNQNNYSISLECTKNNYSIKSSNPIIKYFERKYKPSSITAYTNRRYGNDFYLKNGFIFKENTEVNCFYFDAKRLKLGESPKELARSISSSSNLRKIYDCGYRIFSKECSY